MLPVIGAVIGFASSVVPSVMKLWQDKKDKEHELKLLELQMEAQTQGHIQRLEEINTEADVRESEALYKYAQPLQQFPQTGTKWVDATGALLIVFANFLISTVRPVVTYGITVLYGSMKLQMVAANQGNVFAAWTETDATIFLTVLGHWFGSRMMLRVMKR